MAAKYVAFFFLICMFALPMPQSVARASENLNPTVPMKASKEAKNASRQAARFLMQAQCDVHEALKSRDVDGNKAIKKAQDNFKAAETKFVEAARSMSGTDDTLKVKDGNPDAGRAYDALLANGFDMPVSYSQALTILAKASGNAASTLSDFRYGPYEEANFRVMDRLIETSGANAEVFIAISRLTVAGSVE